MSAETKPDEAAGAADIRGSNYDIIRQRLLGQGAGLRAKADALNQRRQDAFGSIEMTVIGQDRIRTPHSCIPTDIVQVAGRILFGYNVKIGLKRTTEVADVFSLHAFEKTDDGLTLSHVSEEGDVFLADEDFKAHFDELYSYYDDARLRQLRKLDTHLLAIFQTGTTLDDNRVLCWGLADDAVAYAGNDGEKYNIPPHTHDFDWIRCTRADHVRGKHPHISILDEVFVETVGGDLTIKVEDNTEDGRGVYREPVDDKHQSLGDGEFLYAKIGALILIKLLPYREEQWRYFVFNTLTQQVDRVDAIGQSCVTLPEEQGVIFPGGYVLSEGRAKRFDGDIAGMRVHETVRSANGEDVLYVFYRPSDGHYMLLAYNVIHKTVANPIACHGYSLFDDGTMVVFRFQGDEPTRIHPMQIWQTPIISDEFAAAQPTDKTFLGNLGKQELVRGIRDVYGVCNMLEELEPTLPVYEALITSAQRLLDAYFWLGEDEVGDLQTDVQTIISTAEQVIDEFRKVREMQARAAEAMAEAVEAQRGLLADVRYGDWDEIDRFVHGLDALRRQRGHLITLGELRYIDQARLDELEAEVVERYDSLSGSTADFLLRDDALATYQGDLAAAAEQVDALESSRQAGALVERLDEITLGLNLLTEVVGGLQVDDPNKRTQILENIGEVLSKQNRTRAVLERNRERLLEDEGKAEFAVQFQLFSQSVTSALGMADTPEACDQQLTRLMVQLEDFEGRFSEFDGFLGKLADKREEVYEVFEARKQALMEARQRKAQNLATSAERILQGVVRRAAGQASVDALNAYFAADPMIMKVRELAERLRELDEDVKADDIDTQLNVARDQAVRQLRDKLELFDGGDNVVKFGEHRFSVNTQDAELTMLPRGDHMALHITGSDFFEPIDDPEFEHTRPFWSQLLVSETPEVYRAEYLAATMLFAAEQGRGDWDVATLHASITDEAGLQPLVRKVMNERYDEGYERGVHDEDAAAILEKILGMYTTAGLLRFTPPARALATLFWAFADLGARRARWARRSASLGRLRTTFEHGQPLVELGRELAAHIEGFTEEHDLGGVAGRPGIFGEAGRYLAEELVDPSPRFVASGEAVALRDHFLTHLERQSARRAFADDLAQLDGDLAARFDLARAWLAGFEARDLRDDAYVLSEAAALLLTEGHLDRQTQSARTVTSADDLIGQHPRIQDGSLTLRLDEFLTRLGAYVEEHVPAFRAYKEFSRDYLQRQRRRLRLDDLSPQVMSGFVRNQLIDEVYLPLIGDNLAKQMGTAGEDSRADRSGLLLLISPPGYGKTTLMEYIADRLGVMFVKINAPSLGHDVTSLDPREAPNATARQEIEKLNQALEMGNNTMLYLDDIQHTHPEFLQKFISLCDATRRIEGVWKDESKTFDLRGKRFSVIMAGNPYTESGDRFQIPDMLANRADTYNLGDILSGKAGAFEMSYIENALTSNKVTAPLVTRERDDIARFLKMAEGQQIPLSEFSRNYSSVEAGEIVDTLTKLMRIRDVVLTVNKQYIVSAGQKEEYRTEPPFQLQGSYRNMAKMTEKIASAMNDAEVEEVIWNHYNQESQTLTSGSEQNILKLREMLGELSPAQAARWDEIKQEYRRRKMMGGGDDDPVSRVAGPLSTLAQRLDDVHATLATNAVAGQLADLQGVLAKLAEASTAAPAQNPRQPAPVDTSGRAADALLGALESLQRTRLEVQVVGDMPSKLGEVLESQLGLIESAIIPLAKFVYREAEDDQRRDAQLEEVLARLDALS